MNTIAEGIMIKAEAAITADRSVWCWVEKKLSASRESYRPIRSISRKDVITDETQGAGADKCKLSHSGSLLSYRLLNTF